jgi:hypothetical protein
LQIVQVDGRARAAACSERDVQRFGGIGMHSPLVEPVLNGKEVGLEFLGGSILRMKRKGLYRKQSVAACLK